MIYDISPPLSPTLAVFPGDTSLSREVLMDMGRGDPLTLSTLRTTVHVGAHVDAPSHYGRGAATIDDWPLEMFVGACQLVHVNVERGARIGRDHLPRELLAGRLLLATGTYPDPEHWNEDFAALSPQLVDQLHEEGIMLVGIDTPSVDLSTSKDLPAHQRFLANEMAILEGIVLTDIPAGLYELIALPLKLVGFDASPVRAVLRPLTEPQ